MIVDACRHLRKPSIGLRVSAESAIENLWTYAPTVMVVQVVPVSEVLPVSVNQIEVVAAGLDDVVKLARVRDALVMT